MKIINPYLYTQYNIYNFIDNSINEMLNLDSRIREDKMYWLFYYIKMDFISSFSSLYNVDIDADCFGFPAIRMFTRHAIEAFFDLYNLFNDENGYIEVLKYTEKDLKADISKYKEYLHNNQFTIKSKCKIAKDICKEEKIKRILDDICTIASESNKYTHPNVFIDLIVQNNNKYEILLKLLDANYRIFVYSYNIMLKKFNYPLSDEQFGSFEKLKAEFKSYLNSYLLVQSNMPCN